MSECVYLCVKYTMDIVSKIDMDFFLVFSMVRDINKFNYIFIYLRQDTCLSIYFFYYLYLWMCYSSMIHQQTVHVWIITLLLFYYIHRSHSFYLEFYFIFFQYFFRRGEMKIWNVMSGPDVHKQITQFRWYG